MQAEFHDIDQNTDEWLGLRAGRVTSSSLAKIMANYGKAFGEPAKAYAHQIAVEQLTGKPCGGGYSNDHMQRGHEEEPVARMLYEYELFCDVDNGGFFAGDGFGCSPDGLIGTDGVLELKSATPSVHAKRIKANKVDSAYRWQVSGNLLFTGRDWLDFVSFCSGFPEGKRLFVKRIRAVELQEDFEMIRSRLKEFKVLIDQSRDLIQGANYINIKSEAV